MGLFGHFAIALPPGTEIISPVNESNPFMIAEPNPDFEESPQLRLKPSFRNLRFVHPESRAKASFLPRTSGCIRHAAPTHPHREITV